MIGFSALHDGRGHSSPLSTSLSAACYVPTANATRRLGSTDAPIAMGECHTAPAQACWLTLGCCPYVVSARRGGLAFARDGPRWQLRWVLPSPYALPSACTCQFTRLQDRAARPYTPSCPIEMPPPWRAWDWGCSK
ncbi:hypothetical protein CGRA01v4_11768 [Colletotrichum graminicola]|nr:hypothetical protein CGRA01v4_11768 [Colletotrichum graminicola]